MHGCQPFQDGRIAVITKMHHSLADGVAANALLSGLIDQPWPRWNPRGTATTKEPPGSDCSSRSSRQRCTRSPGTHSLGSSGWAASLPEVPSMEITDPAARHGEFRSTSAWSVPEVLGELGRFDSAAWISGSTSRRPWW
jgi:hypothetical protein